MLQNNTTNQASINANAELTLNIKTAQLLLSEHDAVWVAIAGDAYLNLLSEIKELVQFSMVYSPSNTGATDENPPGHLLAGTKYEVLGFRGGGAAYKQVLHCVLR